MTRAAECKIRGHWVPYRCDKLTDDEIDLKMTVVSFITANDAPQKKQPPKLLCMEVNKHYQKATVNHALHLKLLKLNPVCVTPSCEYQVQLLYLAVIHLPWPY